MTPASATTRTHAAFARRVDWSSIAVVAVLLGIGGGVGAVVASRHEVVLADGGARPAATAIPVAARSDELPAAVDTAHLELTSGALGAGAPAATIVPRASAGWIATVAHATGIPSVALRAYAEASLTVGVEQPGCRLGWSTLAAIGGIESGHGTHGGSALREDGTTNVPILGPALDGRPGFAAIRATPESTTWHGDPTWDHAVGPLQMLPSTWLRWRSDGDGDGSDDPNDIDDAALGAARYLCASGADVTGATAWHDAVFSYNHSEQYVADVLGAANRYAADSLAG
ncbi:MAG TPA: murein transglycosylase [Cellulomonas sp.]|uniref:murein transglycosylase n=1 Tax=Cellulomonas sp. TaxID=40001 RepID=UPI002E35BE9A|nr:murein transglycosylase [Cellulomonas sp.]HEX5333408.1 murein transglycosylase [Cellulomonas sp.]